MSTQPMIVSVTACSVRPASFIFRIGDWRAANSGCGVASCLGCSSAIAAVVLLSILGVTIQRTFDWKVWLGSFGVAVVIVLLAASLLYYFYRSKQTRSTEATTATLEARGRFTDIHGHAAAIEYHRYVADQALERARVAHEEKQYGEFWEGIEDATKALDVCQTSQAAIALNIDRYLTALDSRAHDFPEWYAGLKPLQDLTPMIRDLSALKKKGGASYDFASIGEIRETRKEIVGSINKLGEAIRHLEGAVTSSLNDLRRAVNRSALLRAADPAQLRVVVGFLFSGPGEMGDQQG